jgi:hypothetical protein
MFERYTETARRALFFARYEASQVGSPTITMEMLLLGIIRADRQLVAHLLAAGTYANGNRSRGGQAEAVQLINEIRERVAALERQLGDHSE